MKQRVNVHPQTALRNIESSMRAEGFRISNSTKAACAQILNSGKNASTLAAHHVSQSLKKVK